MTLNLLTYYFLSKISFINHYGYITGVYIEKKTSLQFDSTCD